MTERSSGAANVIDISQDAQLLIQGKPSFDYARSVTQYVRQNGKLPDWFGPGAPLSPVAPPQLGGRQFDYQTGYNLNTQPKVGQGIAFSKLRMMSRAYDLLRLIIETRKDEICSFDFTIQPEDDKKNPDARCEAIQKMFKRPDGRHTWKQWLRAILEDALVCDAPCVYPRKDNGGRVISLDLVDGTTIKPIIDDFGRTPMSPYPAYQQYLKGVPAFQYTTDELVYMPRNVTTDRIYGYSPVEQMIMLVNIALRRETHQLSYYTEGSTPDLILSVPPDWTPQQVEVFEKYWNSQLSGQLGERRKTKFVFDGIKGINTKEAMLTDKYDEWLARVICYCFGMSPQPFVSMMNRATANTAKEAEKEVGLGPWLEWVEDFMTYIIQFHMGFDDLTFKWAEEDETDPDTKSQIYDRRLRNGSMSIDEYRNEMGEDTLPDGQGAEYLIYTATGATPLADVLEPPEPPQVPGMLPAANNQPGVKQPEPGGSNPPKAAANAKAGKVATPQRKISGEMRKVFRAMPQSVADQLRPHIGIMKMSSENQARAGVLAAQLDLSKFGDLMQSLQDTLEATFGDRMEKAWNGVGGEANTDMTDQRAVDYAAERAGELISTDADGGELGDATRLLIRGTIETALDEGWSVDELANELADSYAFSDDRADTIAETEVASAQMQGDLAGWKESGVVSSKVWLLAESPCDECEGNAAQGEVPLDDEFDSGDDAPPAHPNCNCSMAAVTDDGTETEE